MLNVLINAYAVAPNWGSEQGMGWNWISNLAKYCNLFIVTEGDGHYFPWCIYRTSVADR